MPEIVVSQCSLIEDDRAEPRHQRQKLRGQPTELLKEFRGQARLDTFDESALNNGVYFYL